MNEQSQAARAQFWEQIKGGPWHNQLLDQLNGQIESTRQRLERAESWRECLTLQAELRALRRSLDLLT